MSELDDVEKAAIKIEEEVFKIIGKRDNIEEKLDCVVSYFSIKIASLDLTQKRILRQLDDKEVGK